MERISNIKDIKNLKDVLSTMSTFRADKNREIEIEFRIGQFIKNKGRRQFDPNISKPHFDRIIEKLKHSNSWRYEFGGCFNEVRDSNIRKRLTDNGVTLEVVKKTRLRNVNIEVMDSTYDIRLSVSKEESLPEQVTTHSSSAHRKCNIEYFYHTNKNLALVLSSVEDFNEEEWFNTVEIEFKNLINVSLDEAIRSVISVFRIISEEK